MSKHTPNAFLDCHLPYIDEGLSKHQLSIYIKLLLGLPLPSLPSDDGRCACGHSFDFLGYHRLNCNRHAGRAWKSGHDIVQSQLAREFRRLGLSAIENDQELRHRFSHLTSQKRGDIAVDASSTDLTIYDSVHNVPRRSFVVDVKLASVVSAHAIWNPSLTSPGDAPDSSGLLAAEHHKNQKHKPFYANIGFAFVPFVCSSFGVLGPSAVRALYALAALELRQHDAFRQRVGLDPLAVPADRAQFRALSFRHISARIGHALAKATVMRLLGTPSLPRDLPLPRTALARNRPGPADFLPSLSSSS